jgi:drug/metabolite transporter (DMT)-like permease
VNTWWALLIFIALISFVAGQLLLKKGMEGTVGDRPRGHSVAVFIAAGIFAMTISFFLTIGLLQRFDLSYIYPFQGLSVVLIALTAAWILRERLTLPLLFGALLISAGIVLVSLS